MIQSETFTISLPDLLTPTTAGERYSRRPLTLILKTSVLLGRIINHHNELHPSAKHGAREPHFIDLENTLTRLYLVAPQSDNFSVTSSCFEFDFTIWLHFLLHTCTILLYHPTSKADGSLGQGHGRPSSEESSGFLRCVNATHSVLRMIKATANVSLQSLTNPFLMPTYFLCCRFLTIGWLETRDQALRNDIDLILLILDRVGEIHSGLARKYRTSILTDLNRSAEEARQMRVGTGSYLSHGCHKLSYEE